MDFKTTGTASPPLTELVARDDASADLMTVHALLRAATTYATLLAPGIVVRGYVIRSEGSVWFWASEQTVSRAIALGYLDRRGRCTEAGRALLREEPSRGR